MSEPASTRLKEPRASARERNESQAFTIMQMSIEAPGVLTIGRWAACSHPHCSQGQLSLASGLDSIGHEGLFTNALPRQPRIDPSTTSKICIRYEKPRELGADVKMAARRPEYKFL